MKPSDYRKFVASNIGNVPDKVQGRPALSLPSRLPAPPVESAPTVPAKTITATSRVVSFLTSGTGISLLCVLLFISCWFVSGTVTVKHIRSRHIQYYAVTGHSTYVTAFLLKTPKGTVRKPVNYNMDVVEQQTSFFQQLSSVVSDYCSEHSTHVGELNYTEYRACNATVTVDVDTTSRTIEVNTRYEPLFDTTETTVGYFIFKPEAVTHEYVTERREEISHKPTEF